VTPAPTEQGEAPPARVLVVDPIHPQALAQLGRRHDVTVDLRPLASRLLRLVADTEVLVLRSGVRVTAEVIAAAPALRLIARAGSGLDNIDVDAARAAKVQVFNIPGESSNAVAELALGLMLASARRIVLADLQLRYGTAEKAWLVGEELHSRTLGLIGLGAIGRRIAQLAAAFQMRILATVGTPSDARRRALADGGIELVDLERLLTASDFVCLAVPLTAATHHLLGRSQLAAMREDAHIVNVSRAGVVDEQALIDALRRGTIAGAATDVLGDERDARHLADVDRLVMTPHIGAMTSRAQRRIGELLIDAIDAGLRGEPIATRVC
jgi:phosphoglycerate dehydrogenase-like enzyme